MGVMRVIGFAKRCSLPPSEPFYELCIGCGDHLKCRRRVRMRPFPAHGGERYSKAGAERHLSVVPETPASVHRLATKSSLRYARFALRSWPNLADSSMTSR